MRTQIKQNLFFVFLIFVLTASIAVNVRQCSQAVQKDKTIASLIESEGKNEIINNYYNNNGVAHTVFKDKIIENDKSAKELAIGKKYADSLEKALSISIEKIEQVSKINAELVAKLQLKESFDQEGTRALAYSDDYLKLSYYPHNDSVLMNYNIRLNEARYSQRNWLFGKREYYIDVFSDDPRVSINGLKSFRIRGQPSRRFGVGLQAGYGITPTSPLTPFPYIGIGLNYNLIDF